MVELLNRAFFAVAILAILITVAVVTAEIVRKFRGR